VARFTVVIPTGWNYTRFAAHLCVVHVTKRANLNACKEHDSAMTTHTHTQSLSLFAGLGLTKLGARLAKNYSKGQFATTSTHFKLNVQKATKLTPCSRALLEKLTVVQLVKKFPHVLWNLKVHHSVHKSPQLVTILRKMNSVFPHYFLQIHFNIILPSTRRSSKRVFTSLQPKFCTHFSFPPSPLHDLYFPP
jgi:hypothetical protein